MPKITIDDLIRDTQELKDVINTVVAVIDDARPAMKDLATSYFWDCYELARSESDARRALKIFTCWEDASELFRMFEAFERADGIMNSLTRKLEKIQEKDIAEEYFGIQS